MRRNRGPKNDERDGVLAMGLGVVLFVGITAWGYLLAGLVLGGVPFVLGALTYHAALTRKH